MPRAGLPDDRMTQQPFHHGNLRAVLLDEATTVLREPGVEGLSLRDLARRAGVSHGAPRSHFVDRQALLDALAESGFVRLTASVRDASAGGGALPRRFRDVARAYVDFAIVDAALMELMFPARRPAEPGTSTRRPGPCSHGSTALSARSGRRGRSRVPRRPQDALRLDHAGHRRARRLRSRRARPGRRPRRRGRRHDARLGAPAEGDHRRLTPWSASATPRVA